MNRNKCDRCGLINSNSDRNCRRCKVDLHSAKNAPRYVPDYPRPQTNSSSVTFGRILVVVLVFAVLGFAAYYAGVMRPEQIAAEKKQAEEAEVERKSQLKIKEREQNEIRQRETRDAFMKTNREELLKEGK